jgi:hypothetical protein
MKFVRSTPYKKPRTTDIEGDNILTYAANDLNLNVFQYGIPLCANVKMPEGSISTFDHFLHNNQFVPPVLKFAKDNMDFLKDDQELIFHSFVDQTSILFSTIRTIARNGNFDLLFIGYQFVDAYTYWYNEENKRRLVEYVSWELEDLNQYGDILYFSDHGSTEQKKTFFVNKWLYENGYLKYRIFDELIDYHKFYNKEYPDQLTLEHQYVIVDWDQTKFYCVDAFDAMIDATENATKEDKEELKKKLMDTGNFNSVLLKEEIFEKEGKEYDFCPEIMPDAAEGVLVSCNIHPNAETGKNMDLLRGGWHSNRAVIGSTDKDLSNREYRGPQDVYLTIKEFISKQSPEAKKRIEEKQNKIDKENEEGIGIIFDQLGYQ